MIGNFDDSNLVFGCLPACLKNGGNPVPYDVHFTANSYFPLYNGPHAFRNIQGQIQGDSHHPADVITHYSEGSISYGKNNVSNGNLVAKNYQLVLNASNTWSMSITLDWTNWLGDTSFVVCSDQDSETWEPTFNIGITSMGFIEPNKIYIWIFLSTVTQDKYASQVWKLDSLTGISNLTFVKNELSFDLYQDTNLIPHDPTESTTDWSTNTISEMYAMKTFEYPQDLSYFNNFPYFPYVQLYPFLSVPAYDYNNAPCHQFLMFDKALSQQEINSFYNIGLDLGGLYGYDNGDGTMSLKEKTYIGNFDISNVMFANLPSCLKNGTSPEPYGLAPNGTNRLKFPLFSGLPAKLKGIEGDVPTYSHYRPNDNRILYDSGKMRLTCLGYDPGVTFAEGGIVKNYQFANTLTNSWSISHTVDLSNPTSVIDQESYNIAYIGNSFMITVLNSYGFIEAPYMVLIQVGLYDNSIYCDLFYPLQTEDISGIKNFIITKDKDIFRVYMNAVELPLVLSYGNTIQEALSATKDIPLPPDMSVFADDNLYIHGDKYDPEHYDTSQLTLFPTVTVYNGPYPNWVYSQVYYNKALSPQEVTTLYKLGPDLGGLYGYDNGDGTMALRSRSFIGEFDNTSVVFAILPACLKNGDKPETGYINPFPIYNGPSAPFKLIGTNSIAEEGSQTKYFSDTGKLLLTPVQSDLLTFPNNGEPIRVNYSAHVDLTNSLTIHSIIDFSSPVSADIGIPWEFSSSLDGAAISGFMAIQLLQNGDFFGDIPSMAILVLDNFHVPYDPNHPELTTYQEAYILDDTPISGSHSLTLVKRGSNYSMYFDARLLTEIYQDYSVGDPTLLGSFDCGTWGNLNYFQLPSYVLSHIVYNRALSIQEILNLQNLGPSLGGLYGYNNGDGTLRLSASGPPKPIIPVRRISKSAAPVVKSSEFNRIFSQQTSTLNPKTIGARKNPYRRDM